MAKPKGWKLTNLVVDNYVGNRNHRLGVANPTLDQVVSAVQALNGGNCSSLCLEGSDESVLCVGGGPPCYHVSFTKRDGVCVLLGPRQDDSVVDLIIGSVLTPLPARFVVDEADALAAVTCYYSRGRLNPSLKWVES